MSLPFSSSNPVPRYDDAEARLALSGIGWQGRLNEATDELEVLGVVKDHIARLSPEELARLPATLRPPRLVDADDVSAYALLLARQQHLGETSEVLDKLARFATNASLRLSQILARATEIRSEEN